MIQPWPGRSEVYTLHSLAGWPTAWSDFDQPWSGTAFGGKCDMREYYRQVGLKAVELGVDGVIITTPHVRETGPDSWRMKLEGRIEGLRAGSNVADRAAIIDGLILLKQQFFGRVVLYAGYPPFDPAMIECRPFMDGFVKASLGPWMDTGLVDGLLFDTVGDFYFLPSRPEAKAVLESAHRCWPAVRLGGEPCPPRTSPMHMACSTRAAVEHSDVLRRMPLNSAFGPHIIEYTEARPTTKEMMTEMLGYLNVGLSVAVQPWTVRDMDSWRSFVKAQRTAIT